MSGAGYVFRVVLRLEVERYCRLSVFFEEFLLPFNIFNAEMIGIFDSFAEGSLRPTPGCRSLGYFLALLRSMWPQTA